MAYARVIVGALRRGGIAPDAALKAAHITPSDLQKARGRISALQMEWLSGAAMQALDDEVIEIPWVGLAHTSGSPVVVPDTVQMHARDSRSYATPLELQQVRSRARARAHTLLLAHMHTRGRHAHQQG